MADTPYIHGYSPEEQARLGRMNDLLNRAALPELRLSGAENILDVGSGMGHFTRAMAQKAASVLGIEHSAIQLNTAIESASAHNITYRQGDARDLPLQSGEWGIFDLSYARFLLEHVANPLSVVQQMVKATRPGGRIVLVDDDHATFLPSPEPPGFHLIWTAYCQTFERIGCDPYIGRRLTVLLHEAGAKPHRATHLFFGGCQGTTEIDIVSNNLIILLQQAKMQIVSAQLLDAFTFDTCIDHLRSWQQHPAATLWYSAFWAEGLAPEL